MESVGSTTVAVGATQRPVLDMEETTKRVMLKYSSTVPVTLTSSPR